MYFKSLSPVIRGNRNFGVVHYSLELHGILLCAACGAENEVESYSSIKYALEGLRKETGSLQLWVARKVTRLSAQTACEACGTCSIVPSRECSKATIEAQKVVTDEWFATAIATLQSS